MKFSVLSIVVVVSFCGSAVKERVVCIFCLGLVCVFAVRLAIDAYYVIPP